MNTRRVIRENVTFGPASHAAQVATFMPQRPIAVVDGRNTWISKLHGDFAQRGITNRDISDALVASLFGGNRYNPSAITSLRVASSVPNIEATFLGTTIRNRAGFQNVVIPAHVNTLCTGTATAIHDVVLELLTMGGMGFVLGVDDQSSGLIGLNAGFRAALNVATGREMPMQFGLTSDAHPKAKLPSEVFMKALETYLAEQGGDTSKIAVDAILESFRDTCDNDVGFMWNTAARIAAEYGLSDEDAIRIARTSHERWAKAFESGVFTEDLIATVPGSSLTRDENPVSPASLNDKFLGRGKSAPGVHSGTSSQMGGAGAGLILATEDAVRDSSLDPAADIVGYAFSNVDPRFMGLGPIPATRALLKAAGLSMDDIDHVELNEAFAAVVNGFVLEPSFNFGGTSNPFVYPDRVNPWGGAISKGHVMGSKFAEMTNLAVRGFALDPSRLYALVTLCGGGGQGAALLLRNPKSTKKKGLVVSTGSQGGSSDRDGSQGGERGQQQQK